MKKIYTAILVLGVLVSACELPDNKNPKAPTDVPPSTLLTQATTQFVDVIDEISMNVNIGRFLSQYAAQVNYPDEARYDFKNRSIPDSYWNQTYLTLQDLMEIRRLIGEETGTPDFNKNLGNKLAIVDIQEVYLYHAIVDYMGDVPYMEALGGEENKTPAYDDAATVYSDLLTRLRTNIATLDAGSGNGVDGNPIGSWGDADIIYSGDVDMWKKAAASLLLRVGMRLADVNPSAAQAALADALSTGVLEEGEVMDLVWTGVSPWVNTINNRHVVAGRNDYAPAATIIDPMVALDDPRLPHYFSQVDTSTEAGVVKLAYVGLEYGLLIAANYNKISHWADPMFAADFPTTLIDYVEVQFILAEAAARGWTTPMSAQEHYEAGITASIVFWGGTAEDAAPYLALPDVAYDDARWKELIGTQKWFALYNRGNEGYASWRIFDWPVLHPPDDMTYSDIPQRWPYPFDEADLNFDSYTSAAAAIGGDVVGTNLFWDVTPSSDNPSPN